MAKYMLSVAILVESDSEGEASDLISETLTHNLKANGVIIDWQYTTNEEGTFNHPTEISEDRAKKLFAEYTG